MAVLLKDGWDSNTAPDDRLGSRRAVEFRGTRHTRGVQGVNAEVVMIDCSWKVVVGIQVRSALFVGTFGLSIIDADSQHLPGAQRGS
jgi:hypothetical protein